MYVLIAQSGTKSRFDSMDIFSNLEEDSMTDSMDLKVKQGTPMNTKRNNLGACYLKNRIYAVGGGNGVQRATATAEVRVECTPIAVILRALILSAEQACLQC